MNNLSLKFILVVAVILSTTLLFNAYYLLNQQQARMSAQLLKQGKVLGNFVALISPEAILSYDFIALNQYMEEANKQAEVTFGIILDAKQRPLTSYFDITKPHIAPYVIEGEITHASERLVELLSHSEHIVRLTFPITHNGETLGQFMLGLNYLALNAHYRLVAIQQLAICLSIIIFLSACIYYVFRINVLHPIRLLIAGAKRISLGDYDEPVINPCKDELGQLTQIFNSMMREIKDEQELLHYQAHFDTLTNLPNRSWAIKTIGREINRAKREASEFALFFIDLNNFKLVNDTMGHAAGDQLLIEAGKRLTFQLRSCDTIARLGGDEFLITLGKPGSFEETTHIANRFVESIREPMYLQDRDIHVDCCIGVSFYPKDGDSVKALMANADNAMYAAKEKEHTAVCFFSSDMNTKIIQRSDLEHDMRTALSNHEFELYFQPIMDVAKSDCIGAETLLRWNHPHKGLIQPDIFIPIAESSGLIIPVGEWVLKESCRVLHKFPDLKYISVNISRVQFHSDFAHTVESVLDASGINRRQLILEITESVLVENSNEITNILNRLHAQGIGLALDDFGTGYSSLSYLKYFPFDALKIDKSFVDGIPLDSENTALVKAIIAMAHSLDLTIVAEGVEEKAQAYFLSTLGCDYAQGYYFGRPMPEAEFTRYLANFSV